VKNVELTKTIQDALEQELQDMDNLVKLRRKKPMTSRQFLTYDGVGPGTVSERQRACAQLRLDEARDSIFEKRFSDALTDHETKTVGLHTGEPWPKSTKVSDSLQRIANKAIRESIKKGEFANLPGKGQPLNKAWDNPFVDNLDQKINVILGNSGFVPEWVSLDKDIKSSKVELEKSILDAWNQCGPRPMTRSNDKEWEQAKLKWKEKIVEVNRKIQDRNLKGPLVGQRVGLNLDKLVVRVTAEIVPYKPPAKKVIPQVQMKDEIHGKSTYAGVVGLALIVLFIVRIW